MVKNPAPDAVIVDVMEDTIIHAATDEAMIDARPFSATCTRSVHPWWNFLYIAYFVFFILLIILQSQYNGYGNKESVPTLILST